MTIVVVVVVVMMAVVMAMVIGLLLLLVADRCWPGAGAVACRRCYLLPLGTARGPDCWCSWCSCWCGCFCGCCCGSCRVLLDSWPLGQHCH